MKKGFWYEILMYGCILLLGLALAFWAEKVTNLVSIVLGVIVLLYAIGGFINFFNKKERNTSDNLELVYAITLLVIAGILIFKVDFLKGLVSFIIGFYVLISSALKLYESIKIGKDIKVKLTGSVILSCIGVFIGIMCIAGKFLFPDIIITYVGVLLIVYSIISIINVVMMRGK